MTTDDIDLLRRKAAAFDAIADGRVLVKQGLPGNGWLAQVNWAATRPWVDLLDAIESAMSVDRQTPKGTFGEVAE